MPQLNKAIVLTIDEILKQFITGQSDRTLFVSYLEKINLLPSSYLFKQNAESDSIYFLERGKIEILLERGDSPIRLSKSGASTVIGEVGFYLQTPRSASVKAVTHCIFYKLTQSAMAELERSHPEIALNFHKKIIEVLANRVIQTNQLLIFMEG